MPMLRNLRRARLKALPFLLTLTLWGFTPGHAQQGDVASPGNCTHPDPATRPDCSRAIAFLARFQAALKQNDREAVASLVNYPLLVPDTVGQRRIRSRAQLLSNFDRIFTPPIRAGILKATPDDVWGNFRGFMVGGGVIWFDGIIPRNAHPDPSAPDYWEKYPFKVITVNPAFP